MSQVLFYAFRFSVNLLFDFSVFCFEATGDQGLGVDVSKSCMYFLFILGHSWLQKVREPGTGFRDNIGIWETILGRPLKKLKIGRQFCQIARTLEI